MVHQWCFQLGRAWVFCILFCTSAHSAAPSQPPALSLTPDRPDPTAFSITGPASVEPQSTPLPASSVVTPPPRMPAADNPALDAEVAKLRAVALGPVPTRPPTSGVVSSPTRAQGAASWVLGLLYLHGIGVVLSPPEALMWFERAHAAGEHMASAGLAWCAIDGCSAPPNPAAARRWLAPLRAVNMPRAQYFQWLIESRLSPVQIAAPMQRGDPGAQQAETLPARQLLLSSAQRGDVQANIELGFDSIWQNKKAEALAYFRAAERRSQAAAFNVAQLGAEPASPGAPMQRSDPSGPAQTNLTKAQRNHRGEGQPSNYVEAIRLYRLAQSQGSDTARKMLELIFSRPQPGGEVDITWMQQLAFVDVTQSVPRLTGQPSTPAFQREPTPLFDLLPAVWRARSIHSIGAMPRSRIRN